MTFKQNVLIAGCLMSVICVIEGSAQEAKIKVQGVLRDPAGNVLPDVELKLQDAGVLSTVARTDAEGRFQLELPKGQYILGTYPPFCGVLPLRLDVKEPTKVQLALRVDEGQPSAKQSGGVELKLGIIGTLPYAELAISKPFSATNPGLGGGHRVETSFCDPRLMAAAAETTTARATLA